MKQNIQLIQENIRLITERLSISDEVIKVGDMLISDIEKNYRKFPYTKIREGLLNRKAIIDHNLWGHNVQVEFNIYEFTNEDAYNQLVKQLNYINNFRVEDGQIKLTLTIVVLYFSVFQTYAEEAIYHEIEHLYQWCMKNQNSPKTTPLTNQMFDYATKILNNPMNHNDEYIAFIIYHSNPREQDAFIHEYYIQSKQSLLDFLTHKTETDRRFEYYETSVEWFAKNITNPKLQSIFDNYKQFGYTANNILHLAQLGVKRFKRKMQNVWKLVKTTSNERIPLNNDLKFED